MTKDTAQVLKSGRNQESPVARSIPARAFVVSVVVLAEHSQLRGATMRYALLICTDETADTAMSPEEATARMARYAAFYEEIEARGAMLGGERLRPTTDSTTVRVRDGKTLTSDGPFAETKEQIGGFYLVECNDLDEAIEIAAKIPGAREGSIEVRPVWDM